MFTFVTLSFWLWEVTEEHLSLMLIVFEQFVPGPPQQCEHEASASATVSRTISITFTLRDRESGNHFI